MGNRDDAIGGRRVGRRQDGAYPQAADDGADPLGEVGDSEPAHHVPRADDVVGHALAQRLHGAPPRAQGHVQGEKGPQLQSVQPEERGYGQRNDSQGDAENGQQRPSREAVRHGANEDAEDQSRGVAEADG